MLGIMITTDSHDYWGLFSGAFPKQITRTNLLERCEKNIQASS